jgi:hypothetical protein
MLTCHLSVWLEDVASKASEGEAEMQDLEVEEEVVEEEKVKVFMRNWSW